MPKLSTLLSAHYNASSPCVHRPPLCDPGYHSDNQRPHVTRRRHTAQDPPDSSPSSPILPPFTADYSQTYVLSFGGPSSLPLRMNRPSFCFSSCMNRGRLWCRPRRRRLRANWSCSSSAKVVEEDYRMLFPKDLESISLPDGTTQTLGPTRVTRLLFSRTSLRWVTESVRNSYKWSNSTGRLLSS
jgi:hypothetical protein